MDLSCLDNFKVRAGDEWSTWEFNHAEYEDIPLAYFNRFAKGTIKYCDLSAVPARKEDAEFIIVEGNNKITNKDFISKNIKMGERRKNTQTNTRNFTKKQKRNNRPWHMQYKTKFKEITAKNDWIVVKNFNKRDFSQKIAPIKHFNIETLKTVGKLRRLNDRVEKVSWHPVGFKENQEYTVKSVSTLQNPLLRDKAYEIMSGQKSKRVSVILSVEFLLAVMTARGGQYPWNILIEKEENVIVFQNYQNHADQGEGLSYIDLFTTNQNTTNNMPSDEARVKEQCVTSTKLTQVFKDLLASGEVESHFPEEQSEEEPPLQREHVQKLLRISMDNVDLYTTAKIDGVKKRGETETEQCLIRVFMETGTDGGWIQDIKTSQSLIFSEYLANKCSIQKWICQGVMAGVNMIKMGFIGFSKQKPLLINVHETTLTSLESHISFKHQECWTIIKHVVDVISECENGQYILSRGPYTPLSIKLFKLPTKEDEQEEA